MKLYKVKSRGHEYSARYIVGSSKADVLKKYADVNEATPRYFHNLSVEELCKRDEIIPCVDPVIEFKNK